MMLALSVAAALLGASWRRFYGSARPGWAFPGYRFMQIAAGFVVLALLQVVRGDPFWRCALDSALAIGFMTLPVKFSRRPFEIVAEWLVRHGLPTTENLRHPFKTWLQGPAPWAETGQGITLWLLAVIL